MVSSGFLSIHSGASHNRDDIFGKQRSKATFVTASYICIELESLSWLASSALWGLSSFSFGFSVQKAPKTENYLQQNGSASQHSLGTMLVSSSDRSDSSALIKCHDQCSSTSVEGTSTNALDVVLKGNSASHLRQRKKI